jgi:putative ABC transport system permease protein
VKRSRRDLPTTPQIYVPFAQRPSWEITMLLRSTLSPSQLAAAAGTAVRAVDPGQPIYEARTMDELLGDSVAQRRFTMLLVLIFGAAALALAGLGIYGMVAFATSTRQHEIAIRVSLGARGRDVVRMVVAQGMRPVVAGVIVGTAGALAAARAIAGLLFDTRAVEPLVYGGVAAFLLVVALAAAWFPARRAARVDPMAVLRSE